MESAAACMPTSTGLNIFYYLLKLNIPEGPEYENTTLYQCKGESLTGYKDSWYEIQVL